MRRITLRRYRTAYNDGRREAARETFRGVHTKHSKRQGEKGRPMKQKAVIAMSGGVDSSVAAYLAKEQGYDCIGVTMKLFDGEPIGPADGGNMSSPDDTDTGRIGSSALFPPERKTCCSQEDAEDARSVARALGIPFYVFNFSDQFQREVMDRFLAAYRNGATPNPCIDCNRFLKFGKLFARARELGCDKVVTGHYARIERDARSGRFLLKKATDASKDQSYVLYAMSQEQLAHALFPLGGLRKEETREIAARQGFHNAGKKDSQDICFVQHGGYADFLERYGRQASPPGDFLDTEGHVLGRHRGIIRYTIGQRKGLGVPSAEPLYVVGIDPGANTVTLGKNGDLYSRTAMLGEVNLISTESLQRPQRLKAKVRYRQPEQWATVRQTGPDTLEVIFDEPQRAITKGQAAVLYDGDTVVGGGTIQAGGIEGN